MPYIKQFDSKVQSLACSLASKRVKENYGNESPFREEENGDFRYKDDAQDMFNHHYEEYTDEIIKRIYQ